MYTKHSPTYVYIHVKYIDRFYCYVSQIIISVFNLISVSSSIGGNYITPLYVGRMAAVNFVFLIFFLRFHRTQSDCCGLGQCREDDRPLSIVSVCVLFFVMDFHKRANLFYLNVSSNTTSLTKEAVHTSPTIGSNVEQITVRNTHFLFWDIGGQESLRASWYSYYCNTEVRTSINTVQTI